MTEAISIATKISFKILKINYLSGYVYQNNTGSIRVFEKNKYKLSSIFKKKILFKYKRINLLCYEKNNKK